jgi:hypothetical protein
MIMNTFSSEEAINLRERVAMLGYSQDLFYLGQTEKMNSDYNIYSLSRTTALVGENEILIIGEQEDVESARKSLEEKLNMELIRITPSKYLRVPK